MDEQTQRDDTHDRKRAASERDGKERRDDPSRRHDLPSRNEQLTRREREERWPVD